MLTLAEQFSALRSALAKFLRRRYSRHIGLQTREPLPVPDILDDYYDRSLSRRDVLELAWMTIARELGADARKLRPADRLAVEMAHPRSLFSEVDDERDFLLEVLAFECRRSGIAFDRTRIKTVDDCVRTLYDCMIAVRGK